MPGSFAAALTREGGDPGIDVARARRQHEAYRAALESAGYDTEILAADEAHPDSPFVEDTAVLLPGVAVLARPGAPSRQGEVAAVAAALRGRFTAVAVQAPATLDGGDVLQMGGTVFVGRSSRTDDGGIDAVRAAAALAGLAVVAVPVSGVLHLKSAVVGVGDGVVLGRSDAVDRRLFDPLSWVEMPKAEWGRASALDLEDGTVVVPAGCPETAAVVAAATGARPVEVPMSEFAKADGGLTCLSLRWEER